MQITKSYLSTVLAGFRHRKTRQKLQSLDDRMLKDIGLCRADLLNVGPIERRQR